MCSCKKLFWIVCSLSTMLLATGCPEDQCSLIKEIDHGILQDPLISSYEWDDGELQKITHSQRNTATGENWAEYIYYHYDFLGRLSKERFEVPIQGGQEIYHVRYEIRYKYRSSSLWEVRQPQSASHYLGINWAPLELFQNAYFYYSYGSLRKIIYHDSYGREIRRQAYELDGDGCIIGITASSPDGSTVLTSYEYDDQKAAEVRFFGDHYYVTPTIVGWSHCDHNLVKDTTRSFDPQGSLMYENTSTYQYSYRDDGLPARVDYTLGSASLRREFFYECRPE